MWVWSSVRVRSYYLLKLIYKTSNFTSLTSVFDNEQSKSGTLKVPVLALKCRHAGTVMLTCGHFFVNLLYKIFKQLYWLKLIIFSIKQRENIYIYHSYFNFKLFLYMFCCSSESKRLFFEYFKLISSISEYGNPLEFIFNSLMWSFKCFIT